MTELASPKQNNLSLAELDRVQIGVRIFGWVTLLVMAVYLINNFLTFGGGLPGANLEAAMQGSFDLGTLQFLFYPFAVGIAIAYVVSCANTSLRADSATVSSINTFLIRAAFWGVLLVGFVDAVISFMRIEGLLEIFLGEDLAKDLGRSQFRGPFVHVPLMVFGVVLAALTRTLGVHWLALLIVVAELLIVFSRFIFSYEQAFMADLVRFWYGALFLFASAYTLLEEGHVRVDVFYAGFKEKTKGYVNAIGSVLLGISLCWVILFMGMDNKASIINSPLFSFEVTQSGFGLYVKYLMAAFLGVFAVSMMIQFVAYLFAAVADIRNEPGKYQPQAPGGH